MYLENNQIVFETGRKVKCIDAMYDISENGVFRTLGHDSVILAHSLSKKEKQEVLQDLQKKIDNLKTTIQ